MAPARYPLHILFYSRAHLNESHGIRLWVDKLPETFKDLSQLLSKNKLLGREERIGGLYTLNIAHFILIEKGHLVDSKKSALRKDRMKTFLDAVCQQHRMQHLKSRKDSSSLFHCVQGRNASAPLFGLGSMLHEDHLDTLLLASVFVPVPSSKKKREEYRKPGITEQRIDECVKENARIQFLSAPIVQVQETVEEPTLTLTSDEQEGFSEQDFRNMYEMILDRNCPIEETKLEILQEIYELDYENKNMVGEIPTSVYGCDEKMKEAFIVLNRCISYTQRPKFVRSTADAPPLSSIMEPRLAIAQSLCIIGSSGTRSGQGYIAARSKDGNTIYIATCLHVIRDIYDEMPSASSNGIQSCEALTVNFPPVDIVGQPLPRLDFEVSKPSPETYFSSMLEKDPKFPDHGPSLGGDLFVFAVTKGNMTNDTEFEKLQRRASGKGCLWEHYLPCPSREPKVFGGHDPKDLWNTVAVFCLDASDRVVEMHRTVWAEMTYEVFYNDIPHFLKGICGCPVFSISNDTFHLIGQHRSGGSNKQRGSACRLVPILQYSAIWGSMGDGKKKEQPHAEHPCWYLRQKELSRLRKDVIDEKNENWKNTMRLQFTKLLQDKQIKENTTDILKACCAWFSDYFKVQSQKLEEIQRVTSTA